MKVQYRILQEITHDGIWETIGVITYWESDPAHMRLRGIVQHTVSTAIWRKINERIKEQKLTLTSYHEALSEFEAVYRLLPDIHTIERDSATEIRKALRKKYVYSAIPKMAAV